MAALDDIWAEMLSESANRARAAGQHELADFITLKATNDEIRRRAVAWLLGSFLELAGDANRRNIPIEIEHEEPHNFTASGANMVGIKASFCHGVRCLTVEAGWTRTPKDGFMRGGALAVAHIRHFGLKKHAADLALLKNGGQPKWFLVGRDGPAGPVEFDHLQSHLAVLLEHHPRANFYS